MILSVKELTQWLGLTPFEVWLQLAAALCFSVLLLLQQHLPGISLWHAMAPLFVCDAVCAYFCLILLIRTYIDGWYRPAATRALWSFLLLAALFTFKYLLVRKLTVNIDFEFSEVMAPLFVILNMVMVRACQL